MLLAISVIASSDDNVIDEIMRANAGHQCHIVDLKSSIFNDVFCAYLLVEGNWNQLSKYESTLHAIQKKCDCTIVSHRVETLPDVDDLPMSIEVIGLQSSDLVSKMILFFEAKDVDVLEINAHRYAAPYMNAQLIAAKFVISLTGYSLFQLRDEVMYFCDQLNADVLFEPFKIGA